MKRALTILAVLAILTLIMTNGAVFILPDDCSRHIGLLPTECIPEEHR